MAATARAINTFFRSRRESILAASEAALKEVGAKAKTMAKRQLRSKFKSRAGNASTKFYRGKNGRSDSLYLSIKPSYLRVFEEGITIKGQGFLVIPIPPFKRAGKRGLDFNALKRSGKRVQSATTRDGGYLILVGGKPAYKLQKQVTLKKRTDILSQAESIAATQGDIVESLLKGDF